MKWLKTQRLRGNVKCLGLEILRILFTEEAKEGLSWLTALQLHVRTEAMGGWTNIMLNTGRKRVFFRWNVAIVDYMLDSFPRKNKILKAS